MIARLLQALWCTVECHDYQMRCENTEQFPWYRVIGWQCDRCGKWG